MLKVVSAYCIGFLWSALPPWDFIHWYNKNGYFRYKNGDVVKPARNQFGYGIDATVTVLGQGTDKQWGDDQYKIKLKSMKHVEGYTFDHFMRGKKLPENAEYEEKECFMAKCNVELM